MSMHPHAPVFPNSMQEIFDKALAHIRTTREPSMQKLEKSAESASCSYRGCGCAMAPFAPSEEAKGEWDGYGSIGCVISAFGYKGAALLEEEELDELAWDIQEAHDAPAISSSGHVDVGKTFMEMFEHSMKTIATNYNLTYSPEETTHG